MTEPRIGPVGASQLSVFLRDVAELTSSIERQAMAAKTTGTDRATAERMDVILGAVSVLQGRLLALIAANPPLPEPDLNRLARAIGEGWL